MARDNSYSPNLAGENLGKLCVKMRQALYDKVKQDYPKESELIKRTLALAEVYCMDYRELGLEYDKLIVYNKSI